MGSLTSITFLDMSSNKLIGYYKFNYVCFMHVFIDIVLLIGTIPSSIGSLTKLLDLFLYHNSLTGMLVLLLVMCSGRIPYRSTNIV